MKTTTLTIIATSIIGLTNLAQAANIYPGTPSCNITLKDGIRYSAAYTGDVNNDGKKDILVSLYEKNGPVIVYYQKDGKFSSVPDLTLPLKKPRGIVVKDIDRDGKNDIIVNKSRRILYLCYAKNNFKPEEHFDVNMTSNDILDVNLNKSTELSASLLALAVWWRVGQDGSVNQTYITREPDNLSGFPAAGDLNNDGEIDWVYPKNYNLILYYGPFPPAKHITAEMLNVHNTINTENGNIKGVCIADYNGDSKPDIATKTETGIYIYNQGSPVGFTGKASTKITGKFWSINSADINNDKLDDIIAISKDLKRIYIFLQKKDGGFAGTSQQANQVISGNKYYHLSIDDINGDGKNDLCVSGYGNYVKIFYAK